MGYKRIYLRHSLPMHMDTQICSTAIINVISQYHTDDKFTLYQSLCVFLNNCCVSCTVIKCNDVIYSVWIESLSHITGVYFYFVLSVTEELESLLDVWAVHFQLHISKTEINVLSLSYTDTVHASTDSLYLVHALIRVMCRKIILILC